MKINLDLPKEKWVEIVDAIRDGATHVGNFDTMSPKRAQEYYECSQERERLAGLIENYVEASHG